MFLFFPSQSPKGYSIPSASEVDFFRHLLVARASARHLLMVRRHLHLGRVFASFWSSRIYFLETFCGPCFCASLPPGPSSPPHGSGFSFLLVIEVPFFCRFPLGCHPFSDGADSCFLLVHEILHTHHCPTALESARHFLVVFEVLIWGFASFRSSRFYIFR